jgi:hypothetical protein
VHAAALQVLARVTPDRAAGLCESETIDLDTTDVEVYDRQKQGVAFNHQGQRVGRPHVAAWAQTTTVLAADLMSGRDDPRRTPRSSCAARWPPCPPRRAAGRSGSVPTPATLPSTAERGPRQPTSGWLRSVSWLVLASRATPGLCRAIRSAHGR